MSRNTVILFFGILLSGFAAFPQDPQFSQYYAAPLYLSPSFAGTTDGGRLIMNYRNQWPAIPGGFVTYSASFDYNFDKVNSGFGFIVTKDVAGSGNLGTTNVSLQYCYRLKLNREWQIRAGTQYSFSQRTLDFYRLVFGDQLQFDQNNSTTIEQPTFSHAGYLDFGSSLLLYSRNYWIGTTFDHLIEPNQSLINGDSRVPMKMTIFAGAKIPLGSRYRVSEDNIFISSLFTKQASFVQLDLGAYWSKKHFVMGLMYRGIPFIYAYKPGYQNNDALIILTGFQTQYFKFGYSYDLTISRLVINSAGAHEISMAYMFDKTAKKRRPEAIPCAKF